MLAIPGTLCSPAVFDRLAERLAGREAIDAVSWLTEPGPWDIATVAERIATGLSGPVPVLGHSTGGAIALWLALEHPELVSRLLLVDTGAHMRGHGDVAAIITTVETSWGPDLHRAVLARSFATPPADEDLQVLLAYAAAVPREAVLDVLRSQRDLDLTARLAELTCPVTVLHGTLDPTRTPEQARELADAIPGATLRLLDAGHTPVYEAPDEVAAEVLALLAR